MISRISHLLDKPTLQILINSLVFSKLYYCSSVWAGTTKANIAKLQLVQNFPARLLSGKRKFDHISPTLKQLKLLPVSKLIYLKDAVLTYKCMHNQAPRYLSALFRKRSTIHSHNTRYNNNLQIPRLRTAFAQNSFHYRAVSIWNSLPEHLKNCNSVKLFKLRLKSALLKDWL